MRTCSFCVSITEQRPSTNTPFNPFIRQSHLSSPGKYTHLISSSGLLSSHSLTYHMQPGPDFCTDSLYFSSSAIPWSYMFSNSSMASTLSSSMSLHTLPLLVFPSTRFSVFAHSLSLLHLLICLVLHILSLHQRSAILLQQVHHLLHLWCMLLSQGHFVFINTARGKGIHISTPDL